jgi:hypothetical protein
MRTRRMKKSARLPKYGSPLRAKVVELITKSQDYLQNIGKGYHFFTLQELSDIKNSYPDGLTWDDIDRELSRKGMLFKKATFRKYISEGNLPRAIRYRNTMNGRMAIFPKDVISHINFILYFFKVADRRVIDGMLDLFFNHFTITYLEAVESKLDSYPNVHSAIMRSLGPLGDGDIYDAVSQALKSRPEDVKTLLAKLDEIDKTYEDCVITKIDDFVSLLKKNSLSLLEISDEDASDKPDQQEGSRVEKTDDSPQIEILDRG